METSKLIAKLRKIVKEYGDFQVDIDVSVHNSGNYPDLWFFGKGWSANGFQVKPQPTLEPNKVMPIEQVTVV